MNISENLDVFVIGSCITDLICYSSRLPKPGETISGKKFSSGFGGKGANQCVAAAKLDAKCGLLAKLGDDLFGNNYMKYLKESGINSQLVNVVDNTASGIAQICVADNGENSIVIIPGANDKLCCSDIDNAEFMIEKSNVVVFQFEIPVEATLHALKMCKKYKCVTITNAAPALSNIHSDIFRFSDIFCVNELEAEALTSISIKSVEDAFQSLKKLLSFGCKLPIITLGSKGAVFCTVEDNSPSWVPGVSVVSIDTTGAGDCFIGAMAFFLSKYNYIPMKDIIGYSCKIASISVQKPGTQSSFPSKDDVAFILEQIPPPFDK